MRKALIILGSVVLAIIFAAGGFVGGMAYQRNSFTQAQNRFFASRGLNGNNPTNGGFAGTGGGGRGFGGGITGQIKSLAGNVLTISTPQNDITINLSDSVVVLKTSSGASSDLKPGEEVMVSGSRDTNGNFSATRVIIIPNPTQ